MIRVLKKHFGDPETSAASLNFVDLPGDIKLCILVEAWGRSSSLVFGLRGLLLVSLFSEDETCFNNAVFHLSNKNYRCASDIRKTSVGLWKWAHESYRKEEALGYFNLLNRNDRTLVECLTYSGDLLPNREPGQCAPSAWWGNRWRSSHIVVYGAKRGKDHTVSDIITNLISCFEFITEILNPSGVCDNDLHPRGLLNYADVCAFEPSRTYNFLERFNLKKLVDDRDLGIYACVVATRPQYNAIDGSVMYTDELTGSTCAVYPFWHTEHHITDVHVAWY